MTLDEEKIRKIAVIGPNAKEAITIDTMLNIRPKF